MGSLKEGSAEEEQDSWKKVSQKAQHNNESNKKLVKLFKLNFVSHRSLQAKQRLLKELIECKEPTHFSSDDQKR